MPSTPLRQSVLRRAERIVVKLGTAVLSDARGGLDLAFFTDIARQIAALIADRRQVTVVSSGAIGAGCAELALPARPTDLADLQAVAAVGQRRLMTHFHEALAPHGLGVAQILLTRSDFDDRDRFLNLRNTVHRLHAFRCLPIVNENDAVAVDELRFGDNDMLAALLTHALPADALVILTTGPGLLDDRGELVDLVTDLDEAGRWVRRDRTSMGVGGMGAKLDAARLVTGAGEIAVIASGREPNVLPRLFSAERLGTVFVPAEQKLPGRKRWLGLAKRPRGVLVLDAGAASAVAHRGKSLLATGVTAVRGEFDRGDLVMLENETGDEIGRGLTNFSAEEVRAIQGLRSREAADRLGRPIDDEVIHRDNLALRPG